MGAITSSVKPNGQTKQVAGKTASGYDMDISVPASLGGAGGMKMVVKMTGPAWIVKGAPGTADYVAFYRAAAQKGFIFSDPRAAKGNPGQAKAMARMYEQFADIGGIPYETTMDIKPTGEGPMAGMMAKMGSMSMTQVVESVDTAAISCGDVRAAGGVQDQREEIEIEPGYRYLSCVICAITLKAISAGVRPPRSRPTGVRMVAMRSSLTPSARSISAMSTALRRLPSKPM